MLLLTSREILHYYLCLSARHFLVKDLREMCDLVSELLVVKIH